MRDIHKSKIVVIDDNDDNLELIETFLEEDGYEGVTCIKDPFDAMEFVNNNTIDLLIVDIMMPQMDGIEFCKHIKADERLKDIPVILATAKTDLDTLKKGFCAGANDYVRKPITNDIELLARVKNLLELKFHLQETQELNKILDKKVEDEIEKNRKKGELLAHQSKLAAMGEMIGAIAHQWRQPLNALNINIQNLEEDFEEGLITKEFIDEFMDKNGQLITFMSKTIDDFRNFFRIDKQKDNFYVSEVITDIVNIQLAQLKNNQIDVDISGEDFEIYGFKSEFGQALLNIINNAKDVIVENKIKKSYIHIILSKNRVSICDNGGGIKDEIIGRVFEPYFTTKEQGKGTGMGLYISKMIIEENMGATLSVKSSDNKTCFDIIF